MSLAERLERQSTELLCVDGSAPEALTTSDMITQITKWRLAYEKLPTKAKEFCTEHFEPAMAIEYVHNSNVGEMVGVQNKQETEKTISKLRVDKDATTQGVTSLSQGRNEFGERCEKETINTYKALLEFRNKYEEMEQSGLLTVQGVCDVHRVLLQGLHTDCGNIRTNEAYAHWNDGIHFYPHPENVEGLFYALVDRHNICMSLCPTDRHSDEYTDFIFKRAACLLFGFVDAHPFGDGNGRMCRLLANYVISLITPFPISLYHNLDKNSRNDYISAIVKCRSNPSVGHKELGAMLVKGAWLGWRSLFYTLKERRELNPGISIGPIVIRKSTCSEECVSERVNRIWPGVMKRDMTVEMKQVIERILVATQETDTSALECTQHISKTVPVTKDVSVIVEVFGP